MLHKGKVLVVLLSTLIVLYGVSAAFYGKVVAKDDAYPALSVFMESLKTVNDDYVEPPEMSKVQEGAMQGLIDALDPYSSYLTKEQIGALDSQKGNTAEVGLVLSKRSNILYVVATAQNGPADSAGMRPGDYLVSIDGAMWRTRACWRPRACSGELPAARSRRLCFEARKPNLSRLQWCAPMRTRNLR